MEQWTGCGRFPDAIRFPLLCSQFYVLLLKSKGDYVGSGPILVQLSSLSLVSASLGAVGSE